LFTRQFLKRSVQVIIVVISTIIITAFIFSIPGFLKYKAYNQYLHKAKNQIIFAYKEPGGFFSIKGDGTDKTKIFKKLPVEIIASPNKKYLYFKLAKIADYIDARNQEINKTYVYELSTKKVKQIASAINNDLFSEWLPDSRLLTISYSKPKEFSVYNVEKDTKHIYKLQKSLKEVSITNGDIPLFSKDSRFVIINLHIGSAKNYDYEIIETVAYDMKAKKIIEEAKFNDDGMKENKYFYHLVDKYKAKHFGTYFPLEQDSGIVGRSKDNRYKVTTNPLVIKKRNSSRVIFDDYFFINFSKALYAKIFERTPFRIKPKRRIFTKSKYLVFKDIYSPLVLTRLINRKDYIYLVDIEKLRTSRIIEADEIIGIL